MAEKTLKRVREETQMHEEEEMKRHRSSYNHILSILEADEEEANLDLSFLITSLQQELSSSDPLPQENPSETAQPNNNSTTTNPHEPSSSSLVLFKENEVVKEEKERVIRHLFEASDDELGIPQTEMRFVEEEEEINGNSEVGFSISDGFWELEDEAANYYSLLQSELFM